MDRNDIRAVLATISAIYPNYTVNAGTVDVWLAILGHQDAKTVKNAVLAFLSSDSAFAPTPGQINALCAKFAAEPHEKITAGEAWDMCAQAARGGLDFARLTAQYSSFPRLLKAARQVGWDRVRYAPDTEIDFVRQAFCRFYEEMRERDQVWQPVAEIAARSDSKLLDQAPEGARQVLRAAGLLEK